MLMEEPRLVERLPRFGLAARWRLAWIGLLLGCTAGCVAPDGMRLPWAHPDQPPRGEVLQVLALWGDGIVVQPDPMNGGVPTPGFAARVYLLGQDIGQPLAGDGALSVYLYNGSEPLSDKAVPKEVWNIDPVNLQRLLAHDALGWGYDLWLPWRTYRPETSQVRLVVKYQSPQGRPAWSSSTDFAVRRPQVALPAALQPPTGKGAKPTGGG
jgi:hypothetical protein